MQGGHGNGTGVDYIFLLPSQRAQLIGACFRAMETKFNAGSPESDIKMVNMVKMSI